MHTVFALLCFAVVIHWLIFPYPPGLLYWHCGNLTIAPVPAKQPWWIWINTSCEFIMNDCITTTKQNTTKPCAYFLGYTVTTVVSRWLYFNKTIDRYRCFTDTYRFCLHFLEPPSIFSVSSFNNLDVRDYVNKCISQFAEYFIRNIKQSIFFFILFHYVMIWYKIVLL